jgi:hypothetical protein
MIHRHALFLFAISVVPSREVKNMSYFRLEEQKKQQCENAFVIDND